MNKMMNWLAAESEPPFLSLSQNSSFQSDRQTFPLASGLPGLPLPDPMAKTVTMKTVAAHAGVTQATVSMCLANNPHIPLATRTRIREIAEKLGYRPNPYVSALMSLRRRGRSSTARPVLALVNGLERKDGWRTAAGSTVEQMLDGAIERAAQRGYRAQEFWLHQDGMSAERFGSILHHRGIQGVLLGPLPAGAPPPALAWDNFSAVRLGVPLASLTITSVCNDHFFSSLQVARECHRRGYRRAGLVILRAHQERFHARWDGGLRVARDLLPKFTPVKTLLLESWDDLSPVAAWLKREKPDVVISPSADTLIRHFEGLGVAIPDELGIASLACHEMGDPCSGIWQNGRLIGATAVDNIISMIEANERGLPQQTRVVMVEGVWNDGKTLRPAASSA
jgi:LacI family transcriptional regulator